MSCSAGFRAVVPDLNQAGRTLEWSSSSRQVIAPEMRFACHGYVTNWTAHTLILTSLNYVDLLTHTITFQVWRPGAGRNSYALVGANQLNFAGAELRSGITPIPDVADMAYYSFSREVPESERIHVAPGDAIGWFVATRVATKKPLSVLYSKAVYRDDPESLVTLYSHSEDREACEMCSSGGVPGVGGGGEGEADVETSVLPYIAPGFGELYVHVCMYVPYVCTYMVSCMCCTLAVVCDSCGTMESMGLYMLWEDRSFEVFHSIVKLMGELHYSKLLV